MAIQYLRIEGKEYISLRRYYNLQAKYKKLEEENRKLKEETEILKDKIEFLTQCLDDRDKSIALMQKQEYPFGPVKTISEPTNGR